MRRPPPAALEVKATGYHSLMVKVGRDPVHDAERVLAVRDAVGPDYPLILDANQGWDLASAKMHRHRERRPSRAIRTGGSSRTTSRAWPPSGGAATSGFPSTKASRRSGARRDAIRLGAADTFSVKVCKNGGIRESLRIIELARCHGIDILFNSMLEEGITQAASLNVAAP